MKSLYTLFLIISMLIVVGCQAPLKVIKTVDKFNPGVINYSTPEVVLIGRSLEDMSFRVDYELSVTFRRVTTTDSATHFMFDFTYDGAHWAFIKSLNMIISDSVMNFKSLWEPKRRMMSSSVYEHLTIEIDKNIIYKMLQQKTVEFDIEASDRLVRGKFDESSLKYLRLIAPESEY